MGLPGLGTADEDAGNQSEPMLTSTSDDSSSDDNSDASSISNDQQVTKKRKLSAANGEAVQHVNGAGNEAKRARVSEDLAQQTQSAARDLSTAWPNGLWQRVFALQPPAMLFRLMRVNKRFKYLLEKAKDLKLATRRGAHAVQQVESEAIWMQSRRTAYPSLPRPLSGLDEAAMLRLVTAQRCQICLNRLSPSATAGPLNGGPGVNGVRPVWQFKRAFCGPCLKASSMTDVELFKLKGELRATDLRKGLTFVFLTKDYHIVSEQTARQHTNQAVVKVYLRSDVDDILNDFKEAQAFGGGAQEEWVKGLDELGKTAATDSLRWQRWEDQLPSGTQLPTHLRKLDPISFATLSQTVAQSAMPESIKAPANVSSNQHPMPMHTIHPLPKPVHSITFDNVRHDAAAQGVMARSNLSSVSNDLAGHTTNRVVGNGNRPSRPAIEAHQAIKTRRSEIERRAKLLIPSIEPEVLAFMESFKAAILIGVPFTDADWERLRPRLEAEREHAEQLHYEQVQTLAALHAANPINWHYPQGLLPQSRDDDREWEASQAPLRELLGFYADEIINGTWRAQPLTQELVPYFAADVLTGVHGRYDLHRAARQNSGESDNFEPFLSLDAMKWVFENKVRPLAEPHLREMFLCAGCSEERITKWLAFEGLIQHYGAKHTTDFSKGNITVHWQTAEWTDDPPFVTDVSLLYPKGRKPAHSQTTHSSHSHAKRAASSANHHTSVEMMLSSNPLFAGADPSVPKAPPFNEEAALLQLGSVGRQTWNALDGVRALSDVIRVITVLSRLYQDFASFHTQPLPLDLFTKAVTINEKDSFSELRAVNSLTCSFCEPRAKQYPDISDWLRRKSEKKQYKLTNLLNHFQLAHVQQGVPQAEWINLIDKPEMSEITDLMRTPGMDDQKLALIDRTWPNVLPNPLPEIGVVRSPPPDSGLARRLVLKGLGQATKVKKKKSNPAREYNPNDAIIPPKPSQGPVDLSMFDTDPQPSTIPPPPPPPPSGPTLPNAGAEMALGQLSLAPETLAALQSLSRGGHLQYQQPQSSQTPHIQGQSDHHHYNSTPSIQPGPQAQSPMASSGTQHDSAIPALDADPNISAIIASLHRGTTQQRQRAEQQYVPTPNPLPQDQYLPSQHYQHSEQHVAPQQQPYQRNEHHYLPQQQYQLPTQTYQAQPQTPVQSAYQMPGPFQSYQHPQYPQPVAPQQPWSASQQPYAVPQMQPVPGNPRLMFDPRTGQVYELVPDEY